VKHVLTLRELDGSQIAERVELGLQTKREPERFADAALRRGLLILMEKTSTRTTLSFTAAINHSPRSITRPPTCRAAAT
jgi:ornithine carbamoyltransferase